jgi:murein DD-endopeptidase MepM/ murein hydrolase activator NlpD
MSDIDQFAPYPPSQSRFWKLRNEARAVEVPCRWPLPRIAGRDPVAVPILDDPRRGVDIGYACHDFDGELYVPVFAVQRGQVAFAHELRDGFAVTLNHGSWCSYYAHMSKMFVTPNLRRTKRLQLVQPGEVIGYAARTPLHLRFEVWERTYTQGFVATDAKERLKGWRIDSPAELLRTPADPQKAA